MREDTGAEFDAEKAKSGTEEPPGLNRGRNSANPAPFKVQAWDMGLKPGYNLDKTWDLIEEIEGPYYK
jgi:hypothetical protein